ncbi:hypothetical protein KKC32_03595 [Patescibacteria group bacterium]|nr:hypothetical protein [Patescibacteria group bacterium]
MKKTKEQMPADEQAGKKQKSFDGMSLRQPGGIYFHSASIIGRKNVFVTDEYIEVLANAFKMAELRKDIKNLAYVIMPNFFLWIFRLSERDDNPVPVYGELKRDVAGEILKGLKDEVSNATYEVARLYQNNERVGRSQPQKILWTFEEMAKRFTNNKRYRVWAPRTEIRLINTDELLAQKLAVIKAAPVSERWQLAEKPEDYPYLYLADEVLEAEKPSLKDCASLVDMPAFAPAC